MRGCYLYAFTERVTLARSPESAATGRLSPERRLRGATSQPPPPPKTRRNRVEARHLPAGLLLVLWIDNDDLRPT